MNLKGQGALEYLLLIGGAVLVAAIVIALVTGIPGTSPNPSDQAICASQFTFTTCNGVVTASPPAAGQINSGTCCPIQSDGSTATVNAEFSSCIWATACSKI